MRSAAPEVAPIVAPPRVVHASAIAARLASFLDVAPCELGRVHSVFDRATNVLCDDGRLLVLHDPGPLAAPFGIAVDERVSWRGIDRGTRVVLDSRHHIVVGGLCIATAGARIAQTAIGPGACRGLPGALASLDAPPMRDARFAAMPLPSGAQVSPPATRHTAAALASPIARQALRCISAGIRRGDAQELLTGSRALIGLGEGLTPAGDDVLVGALAVIHRARPVLLSGAPGIVAALADTARDGTTTIAREFVLHALDGHFSEPIVEAVTAEDDTCARDALRRVLSMGATSGADAVAGIRLAIEAVLA